MGAYHVLCVTRSYEFTRMRRQGLSLRRLLLLKQMWPLKQKVAELHHQLNQQRQHHYGSLSDACDRYQQFQNHNSQQKYFQQDFDTTLAFANHERKQRTEESLLGAELRNIKGQVLTSGSSSRQPARKQFLDSASFSDSKSTEASTSISMDELCAVDSASVPSTSRATEIFHLMVALTLNPYQLFNLLDFQAKSILTVLIPPRSYLISNRNQMQYY